MNETTYNVKYKLHGYFTRWITIKDVIGDGFVKDTPMRYFVKSDGSQYNIPFDSQVIFSKERNSSITNKMSKETGTHIQGA